MYIHSDFSAFVSNDATNFDAGQVANGTRCGEGRVCDTSRCVPVASPTPCPVGTNGAECSGPSNGVSGFSLSWKINL